LYFSSTSDSAVAIRSRSQRSVETKKKRMKEGKPRLMNANALSDISIKGMRFDFSS